MLIGCLNSKILRVYTMKESRLDKINPVYDIHISVQDKFLEFDFARLPPSELIAELTTEFDRSGFGFGQGFAAVGMIFKPVLSEGNTLEYGAYFPTHYNGLDVAKVVEDICKEHGLTAQIELAPSYQKSQEEGKKTYDPI
jgi:hypothetical protein